MPTAALAATLVFVGIPAASADLTPIDRHVAPDPESISSFGNGIALLEDTAFVAVTDRATSEGAVLVFSRSSEGWTPVQRLVAPDASSAGDFGRFGGFMVADGDTLFVSWPSVDDLAGAVYVFGRSGHLWSLQQRLSPLGAQARFGIGMALDGDTLLVGSPTGAPGGTAFVYVRSGDTWVEEARLEPPDPQPNQFFANRGVDLDGDTALVGAGGTTVGEEASQGAAFVFSRTDGVWTLDQTLTHDGEADDRFGSGVELDGGRAFVYAPLLDRSGAVFEFASVDGVWTQRAELTSPTPEPDAGFGSWLAVKDDTILAGAPGESVGGVPRRGAVHVLDRANGAWTARTRLIVPDAVEGDFFGSRVLWEGGSAFAMAFAEVSGVTGAVYEFSLAGDTVGAFDPATGEWHLESTLPKAVSSLYFGNPGDQPVVGDWDGDGVDTVGVWRPSTAMAYLRNTNTTGVADISYAAGDFGDIAVAGDWDGDGVDSIGFYRPSDQTFYLFNRHDATPKTLGAADVVLSFGNPGDVPVIGDWDGDGVDGVGLYRESTGNFYYRNALSTGIADGQFYFGNPQDRFVAGDWGVVDGEDTPGVFRPSTATVYLRHSLSQGVADQSFLFGEAEFLPVAGRFGLG